MEQSLRKERLDRLLILRAPTKRLVTCIPPATGMSIKLGRQEVEGGLATHQHPVRFPKRQLFRVGPSSSIQQFYPDVQKHLLYKRSSSIDDRRGRIPRKWDGFLVRLFQFLLDLFPFFRPVLDLLLHGRREQEGFRQRFVAAIEAALRRGEVLPRYRLPLGLHDFLVAERPGSARR